MTTRLLVTRPRADYPEILDDPSTDSEVVRRSMRDVVLSNRLFGGRRAVLRELTAVLPGLPARATLLDVGTGLGDIPAAAAALAARRGTSLSAIGADSSWVLATESSRRLAAVVVADAGALPFRDGSVHVVTCSQLLHHFASDGAARIIREMNRVSSRHVIVGDIRRSRIAAAGLWLASFLLRFHPVSRHDGVASIRRGFTTEELRSLVTRALGNTPAVRHHFGFRIAASWSAGP